MANKPMRIRTAMSWVKKPLEQIERPGPGEGAVLQSKRCLFTVQECMFTWILTVCLTTQRCLIPEMCFENLCLWLCLWVMLCFCVDHCCVNTLELKCKWQHDNSIFFANICPLGFSQSLCFQDYEAVEKNLPDCSFERTGQLRGSLLPEASILYIFSKFSSI